MVIDGLAVHDHGREEGSILWGTWYFVCLVTGGCVISGISCEGSSQTNPGVVKRERKGTLPGQRPFRTVI